jgi:hypothetical protein
MNTGKILIGLSLVMVAVAMIISPSNAAVPDTSCMTCPQGMIFTQDAGAYPGSADISGVSAHDLLPSGTGTGQSSSLLYPARVIPALTSMQATHQYER